MVCGHQEVDIAYFSLIFSTTSFHWINVESLLLWHSSKYWSLLFVDFTQKKSIQNLDSLFLYLYNRIVHPFVWVHQFNKSIYKKKILFKYKLCVGSAIMKIDAVRWWYRIVCRRFDIQNYRFYALKSSTALILQVERFSLSISIPFQQFTSISN